MAVVEINHHPSRRDLWVFGLGLPAIAGVIGFARYRRGNETSAEVLWAAGATLLVAFLAVPPARRYLYIGWMYAIFPIAFTVSHLVLGVLYFGVLTPVAFLMRLAGRDPLQRRLDRAAASYWVPHEPVRDPERYFRQS
jgi:hypothetical protein